MATIYVPSDYINNCLVVFDGYIRAYTDSLHTEYVDIFIHDNYSLKAGTDLDPDSVVCDTLNSFTTNEYYKVGQVQEWLLMFILAFCFALFLLNIRRFSRHDIA